MGPDRQARLAGRRWTDVIDPDCTCHWHNYSDSTGWFLVADDPGCPVHHRQRET